MLWTLTEHSHSKKKVLLARRKETVAYINGCTPGTEQLCPKLWLLRRMGIVQRRSINFYTCLFTRHQIKMHLHFTTQGAQNMDKQQNSDKGDQTRNHTHTHTHTDIECTAKNPLVICSWQKQTNKKKTSRYVRVFLLESPFETTLKTCMSCCICIRWDAIALSRVNDLFSHSPFDVEFAHVRVLRPQFG